MSQEAYIPVPGTLNIADEVISDLAGYAALESYGVVGMTAPNVTDGIVKLLPTRRLRRGILVDFTEEGALIDLFVVIEDGTNLSVVSRNLADSIRYVLTHYAQIVVADVRVHVQGIHVS
ncbi:MAG: Asp23/Gls24 family envelope stress response protein [Coriobacteriales bacterium]|jgi:uncharacterized alkaline shock family protein YloU|nr:Asp23/Gls24 family envelope stress response protein [Coriobacteriales bacterium]